MDPGESMLRPLPSVISELLVSLKAPARLAAHLRVVHDAACQLIDLLARRHPALAFDKDAVRYRAASHDIGKVIHVEELTGPGSERS